jgi:hypothetical protein
MNLVVLDPGAAFTEDHIHWNEELKQRYQQDGRDLVRRPEQEVGIEHVKQPIEMDVGVTYPSKVMITIPI